MAPELLSGKTNMVTEKVGINVKLENMLAYDIGWAFFKMSKSYSLSCFILVYSFSVL